MIWIFLLISAFSQSSTSLWGATTGGSANQETKQYLVTVPGVRVYKTNLQRAVRCPLLQKGDVVSVVGSEQTSNGMIVIEMDTINCPPQALVKRDLLELASPLPAAASKLEKQKESLLKKRSRRGEDKANQDTENEEDNNEGVDIAREIKYRAGHSSRPERLVLQTSRGLVRFPTHIDSPYVGPCSSFHYNPDQNSTIDAYINKKAGCNFLSSIQIWKEDFCPDASLGCRMAWGDISHKTKKNWDGHKTHKYGYCIDFRPLRVGEFKNEAIWWCEVDWVKIKRTHRTYYRAKCSETVNPEYSRDTTEELIRLFRESGSTTTLFNDPELIRKGLARYSYGHDNHLHICFRSREKNDQACRAFDLNPTSCPILHEGDMR